VIRADQVAAEAHDAVKPQYVFTMTDGGFAKRSRISDYRQQSRGGLGIKTMSLANEDRGGLVGAFIVVDGDEILSITQGGQVVRSPINEDFRATGRSTMGVKFVTPKDGDAVAVVTRSVESPDEVLEEASEALTPSGEPGTDASAGASTPGSVESRDVEPDATIEGGTTSSPVSSESQNGPEADPGE
jgi:DNA gyrase subunit A